MATYLYGLVLTRNAERVPENVRGIGEALVRVLRTDLMSAVVNTLECAPAHADLDVVRAHDRVLQAAVDNGCTTLAARFGQTFADDEECRRHLSEYGGRSQRILEEYDGCVEMRVLLPAAIHARDESPASATEAGPGRAYLESLRATRQRVHGLALRDTLGPLVRAERVEAMPKDRGVVFSHLVERRHEGDYRAALGALPAVAEAAVVGPLALYAFGEPTI